MVAIGFVILAMPILFFSWVYMLTSSPDKRLEWVVVTLTGTFVFTGAFALLGYKIASMSQKPLRLFRKLGFYAGAVSYVVLAMPVLLLTWPFMVIASPDNRLGYMVQMLIQTFVLTGASVFLGYSVERRTKRILGLSGIILALLLAYVAVYFWDFY